MKAFSGYVFRYTDLLKRSGWFHPDRPFLYPDEYESGRHDLILKLVEDDGTRRGFQFSDKRPGQARNHMPAMMSTGEHDPCLSTVPIYRYTRQRKPERRSLPAPSDSTQIFPPCISMIRLTMARPTPVPGSLTSNRSKSVKSRPWYSEAIPIPLSRTKNTGIFSSFKKPTSILGSGWFP